jgi:hypothetical protein
MNSPRITTVHWSDDHRRILFDSTVTFSWGTPGTKMVTHDIWEIRDAGRSLWIQRTTSGFRGEQKLTLVFDRR